MIVRRGALRAGRRPSHPLLTALVMFGRPLIQLVTSRYLLASSDLLRPRTAMMMTGVVACVDSIQVIPSLPWWMRFVLVAVMHSALAATIALLSDIVPKEAFVLGRATLNMTVSTVQVVGNALGAILLSGWPPRTCSSSQPGRPSSP